MKHTQNSYSNNLYETLHTLNVIAIVCPLFVGNKTIFKSVFVQVSVPQTEMQCAICFSCLFTCILFWYRHVIVSTYSHTIRRFH